MERVVTSFRFLASTAICCGLVVAAATWAVRDSSDGVRLLAALIGLVSSVAVMLLIAWAIAGEGSLTASPAAAPAPVPPPIAAPAPATPPRSDVQTLLRERLDAGRSLREELDPASPDPRVDAWVDTVRRTIEQHKPGLLGYFDALAQRAYTDDGARLDTYIRRLATIVRELT